MAFPEVRNLRKQEIYFYKKKREEQKVEDSALKCQLTIQGLPQKGIEGRMAG